MKFYKAICLHGHHGAGCINAEITFYIQAKNAVDAMFCAQKMGGVKHDRIPQVCEISWNEYSEGRKESAYTKYYKEEKRAK